MINAFFVSGNVVAAPEVKTTANGTKVANIRVAVRSSRKNESGEYVSDFFNFSAFNNLANIVERYTPGSCITIEAFVRNDNYEDKNGNKVYHDSYIVRSINGTIKQVAGAQSAAAPQQVAPQQAPFGGFSQIPQQPAPQQAAPQQQVPFSGFSQAAPQQQASFNGFPQNAPMNEPVDPINPQNLFADFANTNLSGLTGNLPFN